MNIGTDRHGKGGDGGAARRQLELAERQFEEDKRRFAAEEEKLRKLEGGKTSDVAKRAAADEAKRLRRASGRGSTVLTGLSGVDESRERVLRRRLGAR